MKLRFYALFLCATLVVAQVPKMISYQGKLTDVAGVAIDGTHDMVFRIYSTEAGGTELWWELHPNVHIEKGLFDVMLGSYTSLDLPFDIPYWMEIEIDGNILMPRLAFSSSPYALHALVADSLVGGIGAIEDDGDWQIDGINMFSVPEGNVGIGTHYPGSKLHVVGDIFADGNLSISGGFFDGASYGDANQVLTADGAGGCSWEDGGGGGSCWDATGGDIYRETGYVGIGTDSPTKKLQVVGDVMVDGDIYLTGGIHDGISYGDAGYVLTSDGAGNIVWADPPTGIWNSSASGDTVFLLGGSVGVGTSSPLGAMHIVGDFYSDGRVISQDTALGSSIIIDGTTVPGTITDAHGKLSFASDTLITMGRIGIGTNDPTEQLHLTHNIRVDGSFHDGLSLGDTNQIIVADGDGSWAWKDFEITNLSTSTRRASWTVRFSSGSRSRANGVRRTMLAARPARITGERRSSCPTRPSSATARRATASASTGTPSMRT